MKTAVSVAVPLLGACLLAAPAAAAEGDQVVRVQDGQVRCLLSANYLDRGYGAIVCGRSDGQSFGGAPMSTGKFPEPLNLTFMTDAGASYWTAGNVPGDPANDVVLGAGQTYRANGWTVIPEELRTFIENDRFGGALKVSPGEVRKR